MNFFHELSQVPNIDWDMSGKKIVGTKRRGPQRGSTFNAITAVYNSKNTKAPLVNPNQANTIRLGRSLGLSTKQAKDIYQAGVAKNNRGNVQVTRGRLKKALDI